MERLPNREEETDVFEYVLGWLKDERPYQARKFPYLEQEQRLRDDPEKEIAFWLQQFHSYFQRMKILGVENPNAKQAAAKFAATAVAFVEHIVRVYGPLPEPGVLTGENWDNLRPLPESPPGS